MIQGFIYEPKDQAVYDDEFIARLPAKIIDGHIHTWPKSCLKIPKEEYSFHKKYKPWTDFDLMEEFRIEDFQECAKFLFPGKEYKGVFFGLPFPQINREMSNQYVVKTASEQQLGFYYMPGQYENAEEMQEKWKLLEMKGFLGFKPYPDLASAEQGEVGIYDMLNATFLEFADKHHLFIMLHIPGQKRLRSEKTRNELEEITSTYHNARFIIAHAGRSFCYHDIEGTIEFLLDKKNVWFDTAFLNDPLVLEYLFRKVNSDHIIYGSDAPLSFTRGKDVCINNKHYYVSEKMVPWGLSAKNEELLDLTFYIYEEMRAILYASNVVYGAKEKLHLENIFYENSRKMLLERGLYY